MRWFLSRRRTQNVHGRAVQPAHEAADDQTHDVVPHKEPHSADLHTDEGPLKEPNAEAHSAAHATTDARTIE